MRNFISILALAFMISGCSVIAKSAPEIKYFALFDEGVKICADQKSATQIHISPVKSQSIFDTREIMIVGEGAQIYPLKNAKWISAPSEMIQAKLISAVESSCAYKVSFDSKNLSMQTNLLSLQADGKSAKITLGVTLSKDGKILKSRVVSASKPLRSKEAKEVVSALNLATDEAMSEILKILNELKEHR